MLTPLGGAAASLVVSALKSSLNTLMCGDGGAKGRRGRTYLLLLCWSNGSFSTSSTDHIIMNKGTKLNKCKITGTCLQILIRRLLELQASTENKQFESVYIEKAKNLWFEHFKSDLFLVFLVFSHNKWNNSEKTDVKTFNNQTFDLAIYCLNLSLHFTQYRFCDMKVIGHIKCSHANNLMNE